MFHGNPDRLNKYEKEANDTIRKLEKLVFDLAKEFDPHPSIQIDGQLYYDSKNQPSRFLELRMSRENSLRVSIQRNFPAVGRTSPKFTCDWAVFVKGSCVGEGSVEKNSIAQLKPTLNQVIASSMLATIESLK